MENKSSFHSWRTPSPKIKDSEISYEHSADVVVIGLGNAGTPAVRAAAEAGASVIGIEKMTEERFWVYGRDIGHINSDFLASRGVPKVDPIELFNEWMRRSGNRANPKLVMQFCQKSGENISWYMEPFTQKQKGSMFIKYYPLGTRFPGEASGQKFWGGDANFDDKWKFGSPAQVEISQEEAKKRGIKLRFGMDASQLEGIFSISHATVINQERAIEHGAVLHFGMDAQQLVQEQEGGRVTGVIAKDTDGKYVKYNAKKGVILAAGDFGSNREMCYDLLPDIVDLFDEGEDFKMSGRDGSGIQMGVWAGGRLEPRPLPAMGGNSTVPMGVLESHGALWVDESGRRYCNEGFGDPVFAGFPGAPLKREIITVVFDSSVLEDLQATPPAHMSFWVNDKETSGQLIERMAGARAAGPEGFNAGRSKLYAADTLEELADYIKFKGEVKQNFLDTVKRYNEFCATGRDEDFGKDKHLLNPVDEPPYYAQRLKAGFMIGFFLVTVGGLLTDEYQNILNQKKDPIPGLYATGNCCGRRFGLQYSTPIAGVSIGMAITLGREVGRIAAEL